MLSCVGHRVMVPPRAGTRAPGGTRPVGGSGRRHRGGAPLVSNALCKEWPRTHRNGLWCPDGPWEKLTSYKGTCTAASRRTLDERERA
ncbi:hypothetical protein GL259_19570 [Streptomyces sp. Tu 3180]|nr:hypothetical protein GL259_19570 [Streptomyces sp. Tu 3180]